MPTVTEIAEKAIVKKFAPRVKPTPIPAEAWNEGKILCLRANERWMSHVIGALEVLDQFDTWLGTSEEVRAARDQINEILAGIDECGDEGNMSCCCNIVIIFRFNPDTGRIEQSDDEGLTWTPAADPRYDNPVIPDIYTGNFADPACIGASNVQIIFQEHAQELIDEAALWTGITALIPAILTLLIWLGVVASFGALTPIALALTAALMGVGRAAFEAAMTGEVWDTFACIVFCHIRPDASFTEADILAIQDEMYDDLSGISARYLADLVRIMGIVGMTNAARSGRVTAGDCSNCECGEFCGFETSDAAGNWDKWIEGTNLALFNWGTSVPDMRFDDVYPRNYYSNGYTPTPAEYTCIVHEFAENCFVESITVGVNGRSNTSRLIVYKKVSGVWSIAHNSIAANTSALVKTCTIGDVVEAIQIEFQTANYAVIESVQVF